MRAGNGIKPQDILVLLELVSHPNQHWRLTDLAINLGLSQSEVSMALMRAGHCGLLDVKKRSVMRAAFAEFIIHGLKYAFPAKPGPVVRGLPTAHSTSPLSSSIKSAENDQYVWPSEEGFVRGQSIAPLYPSAPIAAVKDPSLYEWLALIDALRAGRAREKELAEQYVRQRLGV
jgi:hypothetical protein